MNAIQQKIAKTSRLVSTMLLVACGLSILASLLLFAGIGILSFHNSSAATSLYGALVSAASGVGMLPLSIATIMMILLFGAAQVILGLWVFYILYRIFKDISSHYTPFEPIQVSRMKLVAILTFFLGILSNALEGIAQVRLYGTTTANLDIMWFVVSIVIYCMAYIFDYGYQLQTASDETL